MVTQRLKLEIIKRCEQPVSSLTSLQPLESINGLEMYGLISPHVIEVIEAIDPKHQLEEYWNQKAVKVSGGEPTKEVVMDDTQKGGGASDPSLGLLRGPLEKATSDELAIMHGILCGETRNTETKKELSTLVDKMGKSP